MKLLAGYPSIGIALIGIALVNLTVPTPAAAHRLDEYLQATRISVDRDLVTVEMDLTPGVAVAEHVFAIIDTDRDGIISNTEGTRYAALVLDSLSLNLDNHRQPLTLVDSRFPSYDEMKLGEGVIRLKAGAKLPPASLGHHELVFVNTHEREIGAYLINALVPVDNQIKITDQRRDTLQHEFKLEYSVVEADTVWPWAPAWLLAAGFALVTMLWLRKTHQAHAELPRL